MQDYVLYELSYLKQQQQTRERRAGLTITADTKELQYIVAKLYCTHSWKKVGSQDPGSFDFFGQN